MGNIIRKRRDYDKYCGELIIKMLNKLKEMIFGKKKVQPIYDEYCLITYNDIALRNGIEDLSNKLIIRYKYDYRTDTMKLKNVWGYSDSLVYNIRKVLKIPILDRTQRETIHAIYSDINLDEILYKKG